jgi:Na/Pi-cotransporter
MGSIVLLDLMGGVALLLWGLHMVLSGVLRAFGPDLRRFLGKALRNRFSAFAAGLGLTALLQSSTATGLMTASLAADGVVSLMPALAIMLGANVGTTLIVQLLSFDISAFAPVLFLIGLAVFRIGGTGLTRAIGRIAIGLGLILLALHILLDTLVPAEQAPAVRALLASITNDPVLCIVIAAALTWAAHSSVAVVLLVMSLVYSQFVTRESLQAAFGIFMTGDVEAARKLLSEKSELRKAEIEAADRHFERLREGRPESLETTSLHLDVLADLKRIHSHICSVAYPVLEAAGELPALDAAKNDTAAAAAAAFQPKLP